VAIKNRKWVGGGAALAAFGFAGWESGALVVAFNWGRGMLEAAGDAQTVANFGSNVLTVGAMLFGVTAALWGFGLFEHIRNVASWKPSRLPVTELIALAPSYGWDMRDRTPDRYTFGQALRQAGADGTVEISGRRTKPAYLDSSTTRLHPLLPIEPMYFRKHWISTEKAIIENNNIFCCTTNLGNHADETEGDLHVNRRQAIRWLKTEANYWREVLNRDLGIKIERSRQR
jgi:hypothetical protein